MSEIAIVTRPEQPDGPLCQALRAEGLEPVVVPGFTYEPGVGVPSPAEINTFGWVAWTSAAAVEAVTPHRHKDTAHAAVGGATADALRSRGISPALVGQGGSAELAELLVQKLNAGDRLAYPRSKRADPSFAARLRSFGIDVCELVAYCIGPPDITAIRAALDQHPAAVTFASPSAVEGFAAAVGQKALNSTLTGVILASIGPTTTAALRLHLRAPDVVAETPSFTSLAVATAAALR